MKNSQHPELQWKYKSKQHRDSNSLQSEWLSSEKQMTTNAGKDVGEKGTLTHC
jgi:hypothetical protein